MIISATSLVSVALHALRTNAAQLTSTSAAILFLLLTFGSIAEETPANKTPAEEPPPIVAPSVPTITFDQVFVPEKPTLLEKNLRFFEPDLEWLSKSQASISNGVEYTSRGLDHFFSGKESLEQENSSFLRLRFQPGFRKNHENQFDFDLKFRVDLPLTQKRFRLVIGSDIEQDKLGDEVTKPALNSFKPTEDGSISAALKAENRTTARWRVSGKAGIKLKFPIDPFLRTTVWRRWALSETKSLPFRFRLTHFVRKGTIASTSFGYENVLTSKSFSRVSTSAEWREESDELQITQTLQYIRRIAKGQILEHNIGFLEAGIDHTVLTDAYMELDYRALLHDDWLYLDIIPGIAFDRFDDFEPEPYLLFRVEMFFEKSSSNRSHWLYND